MAKERRGLDRSAIEWMKLELMRVAYATRGGFMSRRDPRAVVLWYAVCALAPWFTYDFRVLAVFFSLAVLCALAARIGPLLLTLFVLGMLGNLLYLFVLLLVMGRSWASVIPLVQPMLKLGTASLVSMAAFVQMDPEKISDALTAMRAPAILAFAVSYGYRMVPVLVDEFQTIVDGHRLRGAPPGRPGFLAWRSVTRALTIAAQAFYPLILNTAKRTRTTVESLETRGFVATMRDTRGRKLRLSRLRFDVRDWGMLAGTLAVIVTVYVLAARDVIPTLA